MEFYDKGCQAELGGGAGTLAGSDGAEDDVATFSPKGKKTPDKRRNHLR